MKAIIIGAGGHARTVYECIRHDNNMDIVAFIDNVKADGSELIMGIPILGDHSIVSDLINKGVKGFIVAVGDNKTRAYHFKKFLEMGLEPINAIHPTANVAYNVEIGFGTVIGMSATINTNAKIGKNTIINTGVIIEHEDKIGENCHIAPGTSIAGRVEIKNGTFIGIGSTIKEYTTIGENVIIGAGSIVLNDIMDNRIAYGCPAKVNKINNEVKYNEEN